MRSTPAWRRRAERPPASRYFLLSQTPIVYVGGPDGVMMKPQRSARNGLPSGGVTLTWYGPGLNDPESEAAVGRGSGPCQLFAGDFCDRVVQRSEDDGRPRNRDIVRRIRIRADPLDESNDAARIKILLAPRPDGIRARVRARVRRRVMTRIRRRVTSRVGARR